MGKLSDAVRCFQDNLNRCGGFTTEPETHNLYNGLAALAEGLMQLDRQVRSMNDEIIGIRSMVERIR